MTSGTATYSGPVPKRTTPRARAAAAALVLPLLLTACSGGDAAPAVTATPGSVPVIQPGLPGEPNATLTLTPTPVATPSATAADARFYQEMIGHHAQAVVMVDAVGERFGDEQVASLASRIKAEQQPEIRAMAQWLELRGQEVPAEATNPQLSDHGRHGGMPGMATEADLAALAAASGADADRLFLTLMIRHHEGALMMVEQHAVNAADEQVQALSAEIVATQSKQISQMRQMADRLS